ncbi:MAG: class I SAM-dependent methyltransferase [Verrucomicrobia bacterium]|nr:class I SAM-dependent methyltransferase [Kiritimatiellia bacterium]MCP5488219.1 class I SAM-dependent methyltransferase [Verrucomicrobiota bacterium]
MSKSILWKCMYMARDLRSGALFDAIKRYCHGDVLDVGGWDFFESIKKRKVGFDSWTVLEVERQDVDLSDDPRVKLVIGDGCNMTFEDDRFDTILNIQVLEHVFEPIRMMEEMTRVLKPGGIMIILLPTTSTMHMAPYHFYNFTRYWSEEAIRHCGLEKVSLTPLGGVWTSMASHLLYFVMQSVRVKGMSSPEIKRGLLFYLLYPFMLLFAALSFPLCLLFGLGDLQEEANNHLVVVRKPSN